MADENKRYFSIHNHTLYSNTRFPDAVNTPKEFLLETKKKGLSGIAITDHQSLSGHLPTLDAIHEIKNKQPHYFDDFHVGLGDEIYLCHRPQIKKAVKHNINFHHDRRIYWDDEKKKKLSWKERKKHPFPGKYIYPQFFHFILVARNKEGYRILQKLNEKAWKDSFISGKGYKRAWKQRRLPTYTDDFAKLMKGHQGDIIGSTACLGSETSHDILSGNKKDMKHFLTYLQKTLGKKNIYFELMPNVRPKTKIQKARTKKMFELEKKNNGRLSAKDSEITFKDGYKLGRYTKYNQAIVNKHLVDLSHKTGIPYIISNDSHYVDARNRKYHQDFLQAESPGRDVDDFYHYAHSFTYDELKKYFSKPVLETATKNSNKLINSVKPIPRNVVKGSPNYQKHNHKILGKIHHVNHHSRHILSQKAIKSFGLFAMIKNKHFKGGKIFKTFNSKMRYIKPKAKQVNNKKPKKQQKRAKKIVKEQKNQIER